MWRYLSKTWWKCQMTKLWLIRTTNSPYFPNFLNKVMHCIVSFYFLCFGIWHNRKHLSTHRHKLTIKSKNTSYKASAFVVWFKNNCCFQRNQSQVTNNLNSISVLQHIGSFQNRLLFKSRELFETYLNPTVINIRKRINKKKTDQ